MAELQPPEVQINGNGLGLGLGAGGGAGAGVSAGVGIGGGVPVVNLSETAVGSKRQRRPSVRLGDIGGDQPYDTHARRAAKQWKLPIEHHHHHHRAAGRDGAAAKSSKIRPLVNFSSDGHETLELEERDRDRDRDREGNLESMAIGSWKLKESKKRGALATKRIRSNWISSKLDEGGGGGGGGGEIGGGGEMGDEKYSAGEDIDDGGRDFEAENSESPINSMDNLTVDEREALYHGNRRQIRATRVSDHHSHLHGHHEGVELHSAPSDTEARDWRHGGIGNGDGRGGEDGVRVWLNGLGLGRYAPVFEIHEVDDEVLPMLTLEDLKDMGINAVGSRRKMFSAIQKLGKGFS